jgi:hypothetical protein
VASAVTDVAATCATGAETEPETATGWVATEVDAETGSVVTEPEMATGSVATEPDAEATGVAAEVDTETGCVSTEPETEATGVATDAETVSGVVAGVLVVETGAGAVDDVETVPLSVTPAVVATWSTTPGVVSRMLVTPESSVVELCVVELWVVEVWVVDPEPSSGRPPDAGATEVVTNAIAATPMQARSRRRRPRRCETLLTAVSQPALPTRRTNRYLPHSRVERHLISEVLA